MQTVKYFPAAVIGNFGKLFLKNTLDFLPIALVYPRSERMKYNMTSNFWKIGIIIRIYHKFTEISRKALTHVEICAIIALTTC